MESAGEKKQQTILDRLKQRARPVRVIAWPGRPDVEVGVLQLTCSELQQAYFAAREAFRRKGWDQIDEGAADAFQHEEDAQFCALALVDPDTPTPRGRIFKNAEGAKALLAPEHRAYFVNQAVAMQDEIVGSWERTIGNPHLAQAAQLLGLGDDAVPADVLQAIERLVAGGDVTEADG